MNADHVGRECVLMILGEKWTFARSTRAVHQAFSEWARTVLPDPVEIVLRSLEVIALKDAKILRTIQQDDARELAKAKAENRQPSLVAQIFKPFADVMTQQAVQRAGTYLGFGTPEITSVLGTTEGTSYMLYLLLKPNHPDVTPDKAFELMTALGARVGEVTTICSGRAEEPSKNGEAPVA